MDELAEYEKELGAVTIRCEADADRRCTASVKRRIKHKCGWGYVTCALHAFHFRAALPVLQARQAGKIRPDRCAWCRQIINYLNDFEILELKQ